MSTDTDILVVGGGPVGLLLANLLAPSGKRIRVVEKRTGWPDWSRAIRITPPSLELLDRVTLLELFLDHGVPIRRVRVMADGRKSMRVEFDRTASRFPFVLSHPQNLTLRRLREALDQAPNVMMQSGVTVTGLDQKPGGVRVETSAGNMTAAYVAGCDGRDSTVRGLCKIPVAGKTYPHRFCMADFPHADRACDEGWLWFTSSGAVEAFPLPESQRRWIVQLTQGKDDIFQLVEQRTGIVLPAPVGAVHPFQPEFRLARNFSSGRVFLAGDAAHICSPIGGQGMNCGFADAGELAPLLAAGPDQEALPAEGARYHRSRLAAFLKSARLAERGMWIGTRTGRTALVRSALLTAALHNPYIHRATAARFLMQ